MNVITISRQLGSLGCEVAKEVAGRFGYRYAWRDLINQAAVQAGAPEAALATIDELGLLGLSPSIKAYRVYLDAVKLAMEELAETGNVVIVGRAGQVILKDRPGVLHVQIVAPLELRIERVAQKQQIALEAAQAQVEASDKHRRKYLRRFYHVDWEDSSLYDLTINTARFTVGSAADLICSCLQLSNSNA